jgi:hypothetical protein
MLFPKFVNNGDAMHFRQFIQGKVFFENSFKLFTLNCFKFGRQSIWNLAFLLFVLLQFPLKWFLQSQMIDLIFIERSFYE